MADATQLDGVNWLSVLTNGGPVGVSILILLVLLSVATWAVIFERWRALRHLQMMSDDFMQEFWDSKSLSDLNGKLKDLDYSPAREVFRSGYNEMVRVLQVREKRGLSSSAPLSIDTVRRALGKSRQLEEVQLSRNMTFLAVSASACPFIGLFGTVVGIIRAFHDIGQTGSSSLAAVAPGISEALIATALGLAAAIPAVIAYNFFAGKARQQLLILEGFSTDFLNILERHFNLGRSEQAVQHAPASGSALSTIAEA
ncbi:MAG: protein TolQ [Pseudomonadota bacterium]|jgi:biopolymer transport protein TolQ